MPSEDITNLVLKPDEIIGAVVPGSTIVVPPRVADENLRTGNVYKITVSDKTYNLSVGKAKNRNNGFYAIVGREC